MGVIPNICIGLSVYLSHQCASHVSHDLFFGSLIVDLCVTQVIDVHVLIDGYGLKLNTCMFTGRTWCIAHSIATFYQSILDLSCAYFWCLFNKIDTLISAIDN